jgi:hypothetical protein
LILLLLTAACVACGQSQPPAVAWFGPPLTLTEQATVTSAYEHHRRSWSTNDGEGRQAPRVNRIEWWNAPVIPGGRWGEAQYTPSWSTLRLIVGARLEAPVAYHELCHLADARTDYQHADPRWVRWEQEQAASVTSLLATTGGR